MIYPVREVSRKGFDAVCLFVRFVHFFGGYFRVYTHYYWSCLTRPESETIGGSGHVSS